MDASNQNFYLPPFRFLADSIRILKTGGRNFVQRLLKVYSLRISGLIRANWLKKLFLTEVTCTATSVDGLRLRKGATTRELGQSPRNMSAIDGK